jgi:hypothetical protein
VFSNLGTNCASIDLQTAKINGTVLLTNIKNHGQILLGGVTIGKNLTCSGAQLECPDGFTIVGDGAIIGGSVQLVNGFKSVGEVNLADAKIGSNLECDYGEFIETNSGRFAMYMVQASIQGSVVLWTNFFAVGNLNFKKINVGGLFFLNGIKSSDKMILDLRSAKVETLFDDEKSWPKAGNLLLDNFTYNEFYNLAPTDAKNRIEWLHRQPTNQFLPQPYDQLAGVLRKMGRGDDAAEVMIAKNKDYAKQNLHWSSLKQ